MPATRRAEVVWEGDLANGRGSLSAKTSGIFNHQAVTWGSRTESPAGRTSPEELLAAAHASCFAMALSHVLGQQGNPPQRLDVGATVAFDKTASGYRVLSSELDVRGAVKNIDAAQFEKAAQEAKTNCPISMALTGNVTLSVKATLAL